MQELTNDKVAAEMELGRKLATLRYLLSIRQREASKAASAAAAAEAAEAMAVAEGEAGPSSAAAGGGSAAPLLPQGRQACESDKDDIDVCPICHDHLVGEMVREWQQECPSTDSLEGL